MGRLDYVGREMRAYVVVALVALALAGCGESVPKDGSGPTASNGTKTQTQEELLREGVTKQIERDPGHYDIAEPGTKWDATTTSMVDLGDRMDAKVRETKNSLCRAVLTYDDPTVGSLTGRPEIKIQDERHFELQYMLPETKSEFNRIRGDGERRAQLGKDGWQNLASFSSRAPGMTDKDVLEWPRKFPLEMFSYYKEGSDAWGPLFRAWANGVGGYKAVVEEQTFRQGDRQAAHYRVYAHSEVRKTTVEVIVDKTHLRPLTIKVEGTLPSGEKYNMYWSGDWQTGGKYDAGVFDLPKPGSKVTKAT
jgi:hypothetical protein